MRTFIRRIRQKFREVDETSDEIENYPGFADVIQGPWLMEQMQAQAEHVGTRIVSDIIIEVEIGQRPILCRGDSGETYNADALIVAGDRERLAFGRNQSADALERLRQAVIAHLAA